MKNEAKTKARKLAHAEGRSLVGDLALGEDRQDAQVFTESRRGYAARERWTNSEGIYCAEVHEDTAPASYPDARPRYE